MYPDSLGGTKFNFLVARIPERNSISTPNPARTLEVLCSGYITNHRPATSKGIEDTEKELNFHPLAGKADGTLIAYSGRVAHDRCFFIFSEIRNQDIPWPRLHRIKKTYIGEKVGRCTMSQLFVQHDAFRATFVACRCLGGLAVQNPKHCIPEAP